MLKMPFHSVMLIERLLCGDFLAVRSQFKHNQPEFWLFLHYGQFSRFALASIGCSVPIF
jgi:hypothetical protein